MRQILGTFILALVCAQLALGTSYYVDNSCPNNGDGSTMACAVSGGAPGPYNSIAHVQSAVTGDQHGNSVLLKAGETFREQYTVPAYGTSAGQLTIGSYWAGPPPIISGADVFSSWLSGGSATASGSVTQANMKLSTVNGAAFTDFNSAGALIPYVGDQITITDSTGHTLVGYIKAAGTGETYGSELLTDPGFTSASNFWNNNSTLTILTSGCSSGASTCLQVAATSAYGNAMTKTFGSVTQGMLLRSSVYAEMGTETVNVPILFYDLNSNLLTGLNVSPASWTQYVFYDTADVTYVSGQNYFYEYESQTSGKTSLFSAASTTQVLTPSATGVTIVSTAGGSTFNWASMQSGFNLDDSGGYTYAIATSVPATVYHKSYLTAPNRVFEDGAPLLQTSTGASSLAAGQWYLDVANSYVWVNLFDNDNPSGHTMEFSQRNDGILIDGKNYVTVQNLELDKVNYNGVTIISNSTNFLVSTNVMKYDGPYPPTAPVGGAASAGGIIVFGGSNGRVTGNQVSYSLTGIMISSQSSLGVIDDSIQVDHNSITRTAWQGLELGGSDLGGPTNCTIESNDISYTSQTVDDLGGLYTYGSGAGNVIRYNISMHNGTAATKGAGIMVDVHSLPLVLYGNVFAYSTNGCMDVNNNGHHLYGNTCYHNNEQSWDMGELGYMFDGVAGITAENNIFVASTGKHLLLTGWLAATQGQTLNYNLWYGGSATPFQWDVTDYNFANYQTASSQDANSLNSDPLFVNAGSQFWLQSGSPARGAGTPLGSPYSIGLQPGSSWPTNVFLVPNTNNDLGAFVYTGTVIDSVTGAGTQASGTTK